MSDHKSKELTILTFSRTLFSNNSGPVNSFRYGLEAFKVHFDSAVVDITLTETRTLQNLYSIQQ
jgi:hypothetical protein